MRHNHLFAKSFQKDPESWSLLLMVNMCFLINVWIVVASLDVSAVDPNVTVKEQIDKITHTENTICHIIQHV